MSTKKPHVYPPASPEAQDLFDKMVRLMSHNDAEKILRLVQGSLDSQASRIEHENLVEPLEATFTAIVKQAAEDPNDLAGYAEALAETLNDLLKQQLGKGWEDLSSPAEVLGFFAWLQRYKDTDFEELADDVYTGVELQEETPESTKQLLREFLDEAFKNILAAARSSKKAAELWSGIVHKMLDKLLCDDFFGTEGQRDPRGDRRG